MPKGKLKIAFSGIFNFAAKDGSSIVCPRPLHPLRPFAICFVLEFVFDPGLQRGRGRGPNANMARVTSPRVQNCAGRSRAKCVYVSPLYDCFFFSVFFFFFCSFFINNKLGASRKRKCALDGSPEPTLLVGEYAALERCNFAFFKN